MREYTAKMRKLTKGTGLAENQKCIIPMYGWFGRMGSAVDFNERTVWFYPAHACERFRLYGIVVPISIIRPYEWLEGWELWKEARERERELRQG